MKKITALFTKQEKAEPKLSQNPSIEKVKAITLEITFLTLNALFHGDDKDAALQRIQQLASEAHEELAKL